MKLLPFRGYLAKANGCSCEVTDHGCAMSPAARIISITMPDGPCALPAFIWLIAFLTISMVTGMGRPSTGGWWQVVWVPVKLNTGEEITYKFIFLRWEWTWITFCFQFPRTFTCQLICTCMYVEKEKLENKIKEKKKYKEYYNDNW